MAPVSRRPRGAWSEACRWCRGRPGATHPTPERGSKVSPGRRRSSSACAPSTARGGRTSAPSAWFYLCVGAFKNSHLEATGPGHLSRCHKAFTRTQTSGSYSGRPPRVTSDLLGRVRTRVLPEQKPGKDVLSRRPPPHPPGSPCRGISLATRILKSPTWLALCLGGQPSSLWTPVPARSVKNSSLPRLTFAPWSGIGPCVCGSLDHSTATPPIEVEATALTSGVTARMVAQPRSERMAASSLTRLSSRGGDPLSLGRRVWPQLRPGPRCADQKASGQSHPPGH
ncbi:uncharacterized protein LOC116578735 isoform X2 [Mustela erminea]|uniref:uncharacterized protein LOC116578735 isoform X2 n=1 Tax=Mustela erminea TaxID=36723 RepID=UPI00138677F1|nr:uncharacterized protein LOC116578735 isoform X2 [Mustela erminea]